jgi:hypothetical protein
MYRHGHIQSRRQTALLNKSFALLRNKVLTPVIVQSYLTYGTETKSQRGLLEVTLHHRQLLTPTGIIIYRCRMQAHHRTTIVGISSRKVKESLMALRINGWQEQSLDTLLASTLNGLHAVIVELLGI